MFFPGKIQYQCSIYVTINHTYTCALQENIAHGRGLEANIAIGFASCYINLQTVPLGNISRSALVAVL